MSAFALRNHFALLDHGTAITRKAFEDNFTKTREKVTFTFNGWDGKSYNGESRNGYVYRTGIEGFEHFRFVKVGKGLHVIDEDYMVTEKATGESHPEADWFIDVLRA